MPDFQELFGRLEQIQTKLDTSDHDGREDTLENDKLALVVSRIPAVDTDKYADLSARQLIKWLEGRLVEFSSQALVVLDAHQASRLRLASYLFDYLQDVCELKAELMVRVAPLRLWLFRELLLSNKLLEQADYSARGLLELIVRVGKGWDEHAGDRGAAIAEKLSKAAHLLATTPRLDENIYRKVIDDIGAFITEYRKKLKPFERKLIEKERTEARKQVARVEVERLVSKALSEELIPAIVLKFVDQVWSKYLYLIYLKEGEEDDAFLEGLEDIERLIVYLDITNAEELRTAYPEKIHPLIQRLHQGVEKIHIDSGFVKEFFDSLENYFLVHIDGGHASMGDLVIGSLAEASEDWSPDDDEFFNVRMMKVGDWVSLWQGQHWIRAHLIDKNFNGRYLLFSNYAGLHVAKLTVQQVAKALRDKLIKPISLRPILEFGLEYAYNRLEQHVALLRNEFQEVQKQRMEARLQQKMLDSKSPLLNDSAGPSAQSSVSQEENEGSERLRQMLEEKRQQRQQDVELKQKQQRAILEEERRKDAMKKAEENARMAEEAERAHRERQLSEAMDEVQKLHAGGWIEVTADANITGVTERTQLKIGVVVSSNGKLVLVTRTGERVSQLLPEALAELMVDQKAVILDFGTDFDQTIRQLVAGRREHLAER